MTLSHFATTLRRRRTEANLSQSALAELLSVARPTVSQWEKDRHPPTPANVEKMDEVLHAGGELIRAAATRETSAPPTSGIPAPRRADTTEIDGPSLAAVFSGVGDRLRRGVLPAGRNPHRLGWGQNLDRSVKASPWSTSLGIRTMQLLDRADVDLHALAGTLIDRQYGKGWSNRSLEVPRPEVTAVVLGALTRLGWGGPACEEAWGWLETGISDSDHERPFVLSTVLDSVAPLRPDAPLVGRLVAALLELQRGDGMWSAGPVVNPLVAPSIAHTARAVNALRTALPAVDRPEVVEAVAAGTRSVLSWDGALDGYTGVLQVVPDAHGLDVPVAHFTAAHVLRTLADVPAATIPSSLLTTVRSGFWRDYVPSEGVWNWSLEGRLPLWMTFDAVSALRAASLSGLYPLVAPTSEKKHE